MQPNEELQLLQLKKVEENVRKKIYLVGLSTENPPQSQVTILSPIKGIAENKLVITVAPQKLI